MNALVLIAALACGQSFTVTNRMPTEFKVVNKCQPCTLCDGGCQCKACGCPELEARLAKPMAFTPKTKATAFSSVSQTVITTRSPQGHTHTCPRCGTTWDHASNPSHSCPNCGTVQYAVDTRYRPVTVVKTVQVAPVPSPPVTLATLQRSSVSQSACANGQCATVSSTRRGFFR